MRKTWLKTIFTLGRSLAITKNWPLPSHFSHSPLFYALLWLNIEMKWIKYQLTNWLQSEGVGMSSIVLLFFNKLWQVYQKSSGYWWAEREIYSRKNGIEFFIYINSPSTAFSAKIFFCAFWLWFLWLSSDFFAILIFVGFFYLLLKLNEIPMLTQFLLWVHFAVEGSVNGF